LQTFTEKFVTVNLAEKYQNLLLIFNIRIPKTAVMYGCILKVQYSHSLESWPCWYFKWPKYSKWL